MTRAPKPSEHVQSAQADRVALVLAKGADVAQRRDADLDAFCAELGVHRATIDALLHIRRAADDMQIINVRGLVMLYAEIDQILARYADEIMPLPTMRCALCDAEDEIQLTTHGYWCSSCHQAWLDRPSRPNPKALANALARARKAKLPATLTAKEWARTIEHFRDRCAYCGGPWFSIEHATAVSLGGGTTWNNCLPTCPDCNGRKTTYTLEAILKMPLHLGFSMARLQAAQLWLLNLGRNHAKHGVRGLDVAAKIAEHRKRKGG